MSSVLYVYICNYILLLNFYNRYEINDMYNSLWLDLFSSVDSRV